MTGWYPMDGHTPGDGDASRKDLDDERAGITFPGHDAGVTDEPCTPTNPCRACRERMAAKDAPIEPARPVEDRDEPAGVNWASGAALVELIDSTGKRLDGLVDVVLRQEQRLTEQLAGIGAVMIEPDWLAGEFQRVTSALDALGERITNGAECKVDHQALTDQAFEFGRAAGKDQQAKDCTVDHQAAEDAAFDRGLDKGFERGRQQGDADRAARGQTEFERGSAACQATHQAMRDTEFKSGATIGRSEREAELLDAGWTPPGAVHELEVSTGPTDYEVWRDALTLAGTNVFPIDGTGEGALTDFDRKAQILAEAAWWRHHLINHPTITPAEADQAVEDQIAKIDGDETSWGPKPTIDPANTPLDEPRG